MTIVDEARALLAKATRGCTGISAGWCPNCGDCTCPRRDLAMDTPTCPLHGAFSPHGDLVTGDEGTPSEHRLARAVVEQADTIAEKDAEIARLRFKCDRTQERVEYLSEQDHAGTEREIAAAIDDPTAYGSVLVKRVRDVAAECDRLRAIIDGRETAPTDAEIEAHRGMWLAYRDGEHFVVRSWAARNLVRRSVNRWWSLDATGRPCEWPVANGSTEGESL